MENLSDSELVFLDELATDPNTSNDFAGFNAEQLFDPEFPMDFTEVCGSNEISNIPSQHLDPISDNSQEICLTMKDLNQSRLNFLDELPKIPNVCNDFAGFNAEQLFEPDISIDFLEVENFNENVTNSSRHLDSIHDDSSELYLSMRNLSQ